MSVFTVIILAEFLKKFWDKNLTRHWRGLEIKTMLTLYGKEKNI